MTARGGFASKKLIAGITMILLGFVLIFGGVVVGFIWSKVLWLIAPGALFLVVGFTLTFVTATRLANAAKSKSAAGQAYAEENGLTFQDRVQGLADEFRVLDGSTDWNVDAFSVVQGAEHGREVVSLDRRGGIEDVERRSPGSYSRSITFDGGVGQLVNAARLSGTVPALVLRKRDGLDQEGLQLGDDTVPVESEAFNRRWWVRTDDKRLAHAVLTPTMITRLLADDAAGIDLCFEGAWVFSTQPAVTSDPDYARHRRLVGEVAALVPDFVLDGRY